MSFLEKHLKTIHTKESYISITVGFFTVLVVSLVIYKYFSDTVQSKNKLNQETNKISTEEKITNRENSYTVANGERLWDIAMKFYGDGYDWVKIAKANNLSNPNTIHQGNILVIPK